MSILLQKGETMESVAAEVYDAVNAQLPEEKAKAIRDMAATAKYLQQTGSMRSEGLGQRIGEVPARVAHRWNQEVPGCWNDKAFKQEFFYDNPQLCAPGYRPKPSSLRHSFTFVDGKPVRVRNGGDIYREMKAKVNASLRESA